MSSFRPYLIILFVIAVIALTVKTCRSCRNDGDELAEQQLLDKAVLSEILRPDPLRTSYYAPGTDSMPWNGRKLKINYLGGPLGRVFNDSNYLQLAVARQIGIRPISDPSLAWSNTRPLVKVSSNADYYIDNLKHSLPFLIPEAADLLKDIGRSFRDTLQARGGGDYRIKVTSLLRTPTTVSALKRHNVNAVEESTHIYGTTFDISYSKFICDDATLPRTQEDLKNLLGEIIFRLREEGRCYVKYERRQACFHITVR